MSIIQSKTVDLYQKSVNFIEKVGFSIKIDQFLIKSNFFDINSKLDSKSRSKFNRRDDFDACPDVIRIEKVD